MAFVACSDENSGSSGTIAGPVESSDSQTDVSSGSVNESSGREISAIGSSSSLVSSSSSVESSLSMENTEPKAADCVTSVSAQITIKNVENINMSCSASTKDWTVFNYDTRILYTCDGLQWHESEVNLCEPETPPEKPALEVSVEYGSMTDARDGQTYKTVVIGGKEWMAENLNFYKSSDGSIVIDSSFCYEDNPSNCEKYGRLYQEFDAAEACPEGWAMPTQNDWFDLSRVMEKDFPGYSLNEVARAATGWDDDDLVSNNASGFSAIAAGMRDNRGKYTYAESRAYFWGDKGQLYYSWVLDKTHEFYNESRMYAYYAYSLRCVKK